MKVVAQVAGDVDGIPLRPIDGKPTLVYWDIVGLARTIRFALVLAGIDDWVDVLLADEESYNAVKATKLMKDPNFAFPNLPYYMDGEVTLTQSMAILRYIGRKYNLMGVSGLEHVVDMVIDQVIDVEEKITNYCYTDESPVLVAHMIETVAPVQLKQFDTLLAGKDYVTGDVVSIADLKLFSFLLKVEIIVSDLDIQSIASWLSDNPNLGSFLTRMKNIPSLKTYMEGPCYMARPINFGSAKSIFS